MPTKRSATIRRATIHTAGALRDRVAARASDLTELAGLTGVAVSVGGITHNPWWGGLTGSVFLVLLSILTDRAAPAPGAGRGAMSDQARP